MKMEPIVSSETSVIRTQTPGNYPKRNNLHFTLIPMGIIVSVFEHFGLRTTFRNELSS